MLQQQQNKNKKKNKKRKQNKNTYVSVLHQSYSVPESSRSGSLKQGPFCSDTCGVSFMCVYSLVNSRNFLCQCFQFRLYNQNKWSFYRTSYRSVTYGYLPSRRSTLNTDVRQMLFFTGHASASHTRKYCVDRSRSSNTTQNLCGYIHYLFT